MQSGEIYKNYPVSLKLGLTLRTVVLSFAGTGAIFHATIAYIIKCISRAFKLDVLFNNINISMNKFKKLSGSGVSKWRMEMVVFLKEIKTPVKGSSWPG